MFDVRADMVVYGTTVGGSMPSGVACGRADLMRRFEPDRPMRLAYVASTFSGHPRVMSAMDAVLGWATGLDAPAAYAEMHRRCATWALVTH